jgi:prepilin-type N-terminal cleavage/methylation domain-containing protein
MNASASGRNRAFTMVELLVVVAIIGVLAAIMVPVARNFIQNGRSAKDVNNLRAIGTGFMLYAQEHHMKLPPIRPYNTNSWKGPYYSELVSPYLGQPSPCKNINGMVQTYGPWRCPGGWAPHNISDYAVNNFVLSDQGKKMPLSRIPKPSSTILLANAGGTNPQFPSGKQYSWFLNAWNQYSLPDPTSPAPNGEWPVFIWNGETTFHALFVDGGVKSISKDDFRQNYKTYLGTWPLWDGL